MSSTSTGSDGLSNSIVDTVRLMRHEGIRVAISTQNPMVLAPELLELVTIAVIHRFHSTDWFSYLSKKIPLVSRHGDEVEVKSAIRALKQGQALVFGVTNNLVRDGDDHTCSIDNSTRIEKDLASNLLKVAIRPRITADRGNTRLNSSSLL
jgi:hypothetical protein